LNQPISATYEYLLKHYGPLLTLKHLAEVMHSTPNGLRMAITRHREPLPAALAEAKHQVGRRLFFEARLVATAIDTGLVHQDALESAPKAISSTDGTNTQSS